MDNSKLKIECESCNKISEDKIYCLWIRDYLNNKLFLRYHCYDCRNFILHTPGYVTNILDALREMNKVLVKNSRVVLIARTWFLYE